MVKIGQSMRARALNPVSRAVALAWVVWAPATAFGAPSQTAALATPPGQFSVSQDGSASYVIPLRVGPGLAGIAPTLGLSYHSQSAEGDGLMGMAWNLAGLSSIERCPNTRVHDGVQRPVQFQDYDKYCLDGQRLLLVSGTYGQDGAEYRTEIDSFSKVVGMGRAGNGTASFKVWGRDGTIREYGTSTDARIEAIFPSGDIPPAPSATAWAWALNKISDAKGNYLTVSYSKDVVNGTYSPTRIDYAANSVANTAPQSSVVFSYVARPNPRLKYQAGKISARTNTLSEISTYYQGTTLLSKTKLTYQNTGPTLTPRLASVQYCDAKDICLLPLNMQYAVTTSGFSGTGTSWALQPGADWPNEYLAQTNNGVPTGGKTTVRLIDLNGDGLQDLYVTKVGNGNVGSVVYLNTGTGFSSKATNWPLQGGVNSQGENSVLIRNGDAVSSSNTTVGLVDLNGDSLPDLYLTTTTPGLPPVQTAYLNTGTGFSSAGTSWPLPPTAASQHESSSQNYLGQTNKITGRKTLARLVDLNGDGLQDLYVTKVGTDGFGRPLIPTVYFNTGTGFSSGATSWPLPEATVYTSALGESINETYCCQSDAITDSKSAVDLVDLNGDGLDDLFITTGNTGIFDVYLNTGLGFSRKVRNWRLPEVSAQRESSSHEFPDSFPSSTSMTKVSLVDLNGDGLPDLYVTKGGNNGVFGPTIPVVYLNTGNGFSSTPTTWALPDATYQNETFDISACCETNPTSHGNTTVSLTDLNGDGLPDLYVTKSISGSRYAPDPKVYFNQSQPPHLLSQVGSSIGASTTITYGVLSNPALYTKDSGGNAAVYPKLDMLRSGPVVASAGHDNGIGGTNTIIYSYGGLKSDVGPRRGMLGFRWIKSKNVATGIEQYSEYRQDFPYIGMLAKNEMRLAAAGNAGVLKRTTNTAACHIAATGAACTPATGVIYHPYVAGSVEENWDLNGVSTPSFTHSTQFTSFPHYGGPSQTSTVSSDGIGKTTTFAYWPADLKNWIVGRVKSTVVTSSNP
ncbi:FG-GAP-like repeat-containing protein [Massilia sp. P8910]|uniref:FG-GAP-like repeat-containing protein n=1 Tax=Massilia antarctica TaxID=2765360 RepID=UPI001E35BF23|nr:FG-GAP-like repeat-containing protein [Massilia antarctica]MCE3603623.1 FG-GAP-like repeat-containing protein [Massilia antarctica]